MSDRARAEAVIEFGLILLNAEGRIDLWSRGAEQIFGYSSPEAEGRTIDFLFLPEDQREGVPEQELETAQREGKASDRRHMMRRDGSVFYADGVTTAAFADGRCVGYAKILRDASEILQTERRLNMQVEVGRLLDPNAPFDDTTRDILRTICESLRWEIGAFRTVANDRLVCVQNWHSEEIDAELASRLCSDFDFALGEGMPGEVWERSEALWVSDFRDQQRYPRAVVAARAGIQAAFAFPLTVGSRVLGVMEFFGRDRQPPDPELLAVMKVVGSQVGEFFEQRQTLHALQRSEELYRLVSETAQEVILTIDEQSTILTCNGAIERVLGWKPSELIGRSLHTIIPHRMREQHARGMQHYIDSEEKRIPWSGVELPALHRNGHEVATEISFGVWKTDGSRIFSGFVRDITERTRASEEIKRALEEEKAARDEADAANQQLARRAEEEAAFASLAAVLNGAVELDQILDEITSRATDLTRADGVYIERIIPSGAEARVRVAWARGVGTPQRGLEVGFPGSLTEEILRDRRPLIMADMRGFGEMMAPYLKRSCPDCELLVAPLFAAEQPLGALVLLNSGRSGRRFHEADIDRAATLADLASLALRRVRLIEEERDAKERAEAAVQAREETLGVVSHDLRNPISKIALSAQLLQEGDEKERGELIETIVDSARQAERLIQDLLDIARVESGRFSINAEPVDTAALVREVCASHGPLVAQKKQRIECRLEEPLPEIEVDKLRVLQVFGNLIGNAMKFAPEDSTIFVEARQESSSVRFAVSDEGPGFPEEDLLQLFRGKWQARQTAHLGAGLGLAIVRGIVEAHGGSVEAANRKSGGARIVFAIPVGGAPV